MENRPSEELELWKIVAVRILNIEGGWKEPEQVSLLQLLNEFMIEKCSVKYFLANAPVSKVI